MSRDVPAGEGLIDLLDALEAALVGARRVVFTPNVLVHEDAALDLIDRARRALPDDVKQARQVIDARDGIIAAAEEAASARLGDAHAEAERVVAAAHAEAQRAVDAGRAEADRMVRDAQAHALTMVGEHEISRAAAERAAATAAEAANAAAQVRLESDRYARDLLGGLEQHVGKVHAALRKALEALPRA